MRSLMLSRTLKVKLAHPAFVPVLLLLVSILAYGLLIPWLHLYIDDWIWFWTWEKFGSQGLTHYFSTNRPVWGLIFQVTIPLFSRSILGSHIFALLVRWGSSLACWWLFRLLWPGKDRAALYGALIFLIYPGFALQPIALTYGHIFLIYLVFLLSLCFSLLALRSPRHYLAYTAAACLLSLVNLASMEFFFTLELARPFLMALVISEKETTFRGRIAAASRHWLPYLAVFAGVVIWRAFFFRYQTYYHPIYLLDRLKAQPVNTLLVLVGTILQDLLDTSLGAWLPVFERFASLNLRQANSLVTLALSGILLVMVAAVLLFSPKNELEQVEKPQRWFPWQLIGVGLILMLASGWPFWLTMLEVQPVEFNSRMTIPFILGAAMFITGLLHWIPSSRLRAALLAVSVAAACGYHFQIANDFRLDWVQNQKLMWQIAWRIPAMEEGTTLLISDFPVTYYNIATLSTELNEIYPVQERYPDLAYYMQYSRKLDMDLQNGLEAGRPIKGSNVSAEFRGSTSQVLAAQYDLGRCFRLLEPDLDASDESLHNHLRKAAQLSRMEWVRVDQPANQPPERFFGKAPSDEWCYYFEKADLARQKKDWQEAVRLWDAAQAANLQPRDEMEKLVFIESFAYLGKWDRAIEISDRFQSEEKRPVLCRLWNRVFASTPQSDEKAKAKNTISASCQQTIPIR